MNVIDVLGIRQNRHHICCTVLPLLQSRWVIIDLRFVVVPQDVLYASILIGCLSAPVDAFSEEGVLVLQRRPNLRCTLVTIGDVGKCKRRGVMEDNRDLTAASADI